MVNEMPGFRGLFVKYNAKNSYFLWEEIWGERHKKYDIRRLEPENGLLRA